MTGKARHIAVIDIGKTNAKVALVDTVRFVEVAVRSTPNRVLRSGPYPHYDVEGTWSFILGALGVLNREHPIDAIVVTTHGASCALLDAESALALPVLDYEYEGPDSLAADYDFIRPTFAEIGSPRLPGGLNLGAQIFWQSRRFPDQFANVTAIVTYPQYWALRLCGYAANEVSSLGAHTDLWRPVAADFSSLVDTLDWRALFAPIRQASDQLGTILPDIAAQTGLSAQTAVHCGIHDSNASLLPHLLARRPPFTVISTGTWVVSMAIGGAPVRLDPRRDTLLNVNALGAPVASARFMGGREYDMLAGGLNADVTPADVAAVLEKNIMHLPAVQQGSGPFPDRGAEWRGAELISPGERQAAIWLYLALVTAICMDLIGADGPGVIEGPFARNPLYLRMLAAASGRGVIPKTGGGTGTSLGAALLASGGALPHAEDEQTITNADPAWIAYARAWRAEVERDPS